MNLEEYKGTCNYQVKVKTVDPTAACTMTLSAGVLSSAVTASMIIFLSCYKRYSEY